MCITLWFNAYLIKEVFCLYLCGEVFLGWEMFFSYFLSTNQPRTPQRLHILRTLYLIHNFCTTCTQTQHKHIFSTLHISHITSNCMTCGTSHQTSHTTLHKRCPHSIHSIPPASHTHNVHITCTSHIYLVQHLDHYHIPSHLPSPPHWCLSHIHPNLVCLHLKS